jgi:prefoldin subunit 5
MRLKRFAHALLGLTFLATSAAAAAPVKDPDWPCIQPKVPELSMAQIWNGPELSAVANDWSKDKAIPELVDELAARRVALADAQKQIRDFAATLPADQRADRMAMLVQGLFDHMNAERSQVISGIGRYARKQLELAARLRKESSELDALSAKPDADANEVAQRTDELAGETRVFEERVQSLTYVCEVPTLIEQRLYALAKTVAEVSAGK